MTVLDLGTVLSSLEHDLTLSDKILTAVLDVDARTLDRWRKGDCYPQKEARARIDRLMAIHRRLVDFFTEKQYVRSWMRTDSRYLGGLKPAEVLGAGRIDRVEAALEALASGAFV
jgi:uncharacterized protein (DUF2384 family)